ncbi:hypothetical protein CHUAL_009069 [Chamberlinius hualienensis]
MCTLLTGKLRGLRFVSYLSSNTARLKKEMAFSKTRSLTTETSSLEPVITEKVGQVFLIGINRPDKRNCVNSYTASLLLKEFERFESDDSVRVAILHGIGGNFCAGYDLSEVASSPDVETAASVLTGLSSEKRPMGPTHMQFSKPTIAAVTGYAVAGGLELALLCDLRVVEETAVMGVFCRRFGVPLMDGGTVRLPQVIGLGRALDLILTGRPVEAKEAFEMGLANRVVKCGTALGQAVNLAHSICKFPQDCMKVDRKSAIYSMTATSLKDALNYEWDNSVNIIAKESVQGAKNFTQGIGRHGKFNVDEKFSPKL